MSILSIVLWPDRGLRASCAGVGGGDVADLVRDMFDTMYAAPGRGLAAPQVGVSRRIFVMDCTWKDGERSPVACIDPVIISVSDARDVVDEGCLSIPGVLVPVERPVSVVLEYRDVAGGVHRDALDGFAARCAQHELDHLNGVLHFDHVGDDLRDEIMAGYRK
ncbi:MAG: peptide deformylase [Rhodobacterales bacterium]|nr:peptide deformylase [Rhodobacterales bacterium]